jgi:hypothetical protein
MAMILSNPGSTGTTRFGAYPTNYAEFSENGVLRLYGEATAWDDFSVPLTRDKQGQAGKPDYDFDELGLLFPQDDATEIVYFVYQMPHSKLLDSALRMHIHYIQAEEAQPTFKIDYRIYPANAAPPETWTTISTASNARGRFTYTSGSMSQIGKFPEITPPASEETSLNLDMKLYRDDNDVTGDVLTKYIDFHFQRDSFGSDEEYVK